MQAIRGRAPVSVLRVLLEASPESARVADREGKYPLSQLIYGKGYTRQLVKMCAFPEAVHEVDFARRNAVSVLLEQWSSLLLDHWSSLMSVNDLSAHVDPEIVEILLRVAPDAATGTARRSDRVRYDVSPIQICYRQYEWTDSLLDQNRARDPVSERWWSILLIVLYYSSPRSGISDNRNARGARILQAGIASSAPLIVIRRLLSTDPRLTDERDENGRVPLHTACALTGSPLTVASTAGPEVKHKEALVSLILDADPSQASSLDNSGRYPLMFAAERGGISPQLLSKLVLAYPEAASRLDPKFRLYPFLVAAAAPKANSNYSSSRLRGDSHSVDAIFELLLAAPNLVCSSSPSLG